MTPRVRTGYELLGACLMLSWRLLARSPAEVWRDWGAVLAVLWLFLILVPKPRAALTGTLTVAAYLAGLYAYGQLPHTLYTLGFVP